MHVCHIFGRIQGSHVLISKAMGLSMQMQESMMISLYQDDMVMMSGSVLDVDTKMMSNRP